MQPVPTLLLVDDLALGLAALEGALTGQGYRLETARSGPEALERAAELTPDLILLDVMMPKMDGFEVCRRLRASERLAEIPVIMVTSLDDRESRLRGLEAGADDFLSKPFDRSELRARVRTITRLNRYRRLVAERAKVERLEEEIQRAQRLEAIGRTTSQIVHDFDTYLDAIRLQAQLLERDQPGSKPARSIIDATDRAAALTRQLLAFAGRRPVEPRVLSLSEVIREFESLLQGLAGDRTLELVLDLPPENTGDRLEVLADRTHLQQILVNLFTNARDAIEGAGTIRLGARRRGDDEPDDANGEDGEYILLELEDDGRGMDAETRARIFEPFFSTKEQGQGTGLGLSTVYGLVHQLAGRVRVSSRPGEGTLMTVLLPAVNEKVGAPEP